MIVILLLFLSMKSLEDFRCSLLNFLQVLRIELLLHFVDLSQDLLAFFKGLLVKLPLFCLNSSQGIHLYQYKVAKTFFEWTSIYQFEQILPQFDERRQLRRYGKDYCITCYSCQIFKQKSMQLTELLQRRLKIALNAAQTDPLNSDSIKTALAVLTESLWHQSTALELAESELTSKVGDSEFKRALSGKLSVKEFLGYFQKVERVVEKMENYWSSNEQKTAELLERQRQRLQNQLGDAIENRIAEVSERIEFNEERIKEMDQYRRKIAILESEIYDLQKKSKGFAEQLGKKQSSQRQEVQQEKMKTVLTGLKQIQSYFNETHYEMKSLLQTIIDSSSQRLDASRNSNPNHQRLEILDMRIIRCQEVLPNRWVWDWNPHANIFNWQSRAGRKSLTLQKIQENITKITIKTGGFYKFTLGYLTQNQGYGRMNLSCNGRILCSIDFQTSGSSCLCKTTMLYSWISHNGVITIDIDNPSTTRGFLEIESFE